MRRSLALAAVAMALVTLPAFHLLRAAPGGQPKVDICHIPEETAPDGFVITIAESALPAHEAHGDCLVGESFPLENGGCTCEEPEPPLP